MASLQPCLAANCVQFGTLRCTGCDRSSAARYCSATCQRSDWKRHKRTCVGAQKHNCFLVKTSPISTAGPGESLRDADYIIPFALRDYGNWGKEMKELKTRLGWSDTNDAGKIYPPESDDWYYHTYCNQWSRSHDLPENELASRMLRRRVRGDVAIVRSSPAGFYGYAEEFSRSELLKVAEFYRVAKSYETFDEKERSRMARKFGVDFRKFGIDYDFDDMMGAYMS